MTQPLKGEDRDQVARDFAALYEAGDSIRAIAARSGRAYGTVHRLLLEAGVTLRPHGGAPRPGRSKAAP